MKLVNALIHKYVVSFCIVVFVLLSVIYLIMVREVFNEADVEFSKWQSTKELIHLDNIYDLGREESNKVGVTSRLVKKTFQKTTNVKLILLWSPLFEGWDFLQEGKSSFETSGCLETRCEITSNRSRFLESDAVLFHVRTLSLFDFPGERTPQQKWVFLNLEAPPYSRFPGFDFMFRMFNWTMTYRKDSDIYIPYGQIVQGKADDFNFSDLYSKWKSKSKMAVWMVSHCSTSGYREKYIEELKNFMEVDTYGSCGIGTCPFNKTNLCIKNFSKQYYFFLAFENAICDDYVTEKLFRTFQYDMIPVVFGGANYSSMAPPNSFIDALTFPSPGHLSSHLLRVSSNFTLFSRYFEWRKTSRSDDTPNHCELCQKLQSEEFFKSSVYDDINEWWIKKSNCRKWKKGSIVE